MRYAGPLLLFDDGRFSPARGNNGAGVNVIVLFFAFCFKYQLVTQNDLSGP